MKRLDPRMILAGAAVAALLGLLYWQWRVERTVADCIGMGGRWNGPAATCDLPPDRILVRPGLGRG